MFWFLLIALVVVVAAVTLAVVGGDDGAALPDAEPDRLADPLPLSRPVSRADVETVRFPVVVRGYRMTDVDDVLDRLAAELAERDARIAELETALTGARAAAFGAPDLFREGTGEEEPANGRAADGGVMGGDDASTGATAPGGEAGGDGGGAPDTAAPDTAAPGTRPAGGGGRTA
ncbi:DivIVA domain-containing protein [Streptomyces sp. MNU89]|uniref:DivIVA domain-containing protein n=1 Tax=Streptomyces sp. MNU89 TaxID=2560025 RepID=UPI001E3359F2|nr:DivIVA domain-containing protein [Streptomyces sp. MNU89]MCC9739570.1 DivIVA domain-containing protein [Streptomyces sp. MNU89]